MITLSLDSGDINRIMELLREKYQLRELEKISNFRFTEEGLLAFDQKFVLATSVNVKLSCDEEGRIVLDLIRLTENRAGELILKYFHRMVTKIIARAGKEVIIRRSDSRLLVDIRQFCELPGRITGIAVTGQTLAVLAEII